MPKSFSPTKCVGYLFFYFIRGRSGEIFEGNILPRHTKVINNNLLEIN